MPTMRDPFMQAAIDEAQKGLSEGGIPIGSVIVHRGEIIGRGHNMRIQRGDPLLHGEMSAFLARLWQPRMASRLRIFPLAENADGKFLVVERTKRKENFHG